MGLMATRSCSACDDRILVAPRDTRGVGRPYARCTNCDAAILLGTRNEWDLMSPGSRGAYVVGQCYPAVVVPVALALLLGLAAWASGTVHPLNDTGLLWLLIGLAVTGILFGLYRAVVRIQDEIARSARRLRNADYRHRLRTMGLLHDAAPQNNTAASRSRPRHPRASAPLGRPLA